jgi:hypothetical protein
MTTEIRFAHYIKISTTKGEYRYQNYFVKQTADGHEFAPFQVQGSVANLNGDNSQIQLLFPTTEYALALVEEGDGNRRSRLILSTFNVTSGGDRDRDPISTEFYIGLGASFSEDTIELRFNTAIDSVGSNFPARRLNQDNVGYLPLDSALSLR